MHVNIDKEICCALRQGKGIALNLNLPTTDTHTCESGNKTGVRAIALPEQVSAEEEPTSRRPTGVHAPYIGSDIESRKDINFGTGSASLAYAIASLGFCLWRMLSPKLRFAQQIASHFVRSPAIWQASRAGSGGSCITSCRTTRGPMA